MTLLTSARLKVTDRWANAELKSKILQHIPDVETLSSIVHASPGMHQFYLTKRRQTLTQVTINEMLGKGVSHLRCETAYGSPVDESYIHGCSHHGAVELGARLLTLRQLTD